MSDGKMHRFEVWPREEAGDPKGESVRRSAAAVGVRPECVRTARVYLIRGALTEAQADRVRRELLENPVLERSVVGASEGRNGVQIIEVHPLPGVMDPAAQTVRDAVRELTDVETEVVTGWRYEVEGVTEADAGRIARGVVANEVVEQIHTEAWWPESFPEAAPADQRVQHVAIRELDDAGLERLARDGHLFLSIDEMRAIRTEYQRLGREPTDIELETLAQTWSEHCVHKTLKGTVRYRGPNNDTIDWRGRPGVEIGADGVVTIHNLLKSTVAAATFELIAEGVDWTLSVFKDNAGIIRFDGETAVCVKVETHNHPSAIEPYGGAATGIGGVIRDIMGTGMGARPIASTDVFCVAEPWGWGEGEASGSRHQASGKRDTPLPAPKTVPPSPSRGEGGGEASAGKRETPHLSAKTLTSSPPRGEAGDGVAARVKPLQRSETLHAEGVDESSRGSESRSSGTTPPESGGCLPRALPKGCLHPRRVLTRVVEGVRDYGNRMGIPTVNGAVWFDDRFIGNPLVFCGSVGVLPEELAHGDARAGDRIVALGGRTGRDGIHGATFSSAELTDTHADEFSHAVQIGNAIEEKRTLEALLRARDAEGGPLYTAITDCGAGGFSSAVGEMGAEIGAVVDLDAAPLKYAGLRYDEIWISESQERMVVSVPEGNLARLGAICAEEGVEMAALGTFGTPENELVLRFAGAEVGRIGMAFLHDGIPMPVREATWEAKAQSGKWKAEIGGEGNDAAREGMTDVRERLLSLLAHPNIASKRWIVRQYDHEVQGATIVKPLVGPGGDGPGDAAVVQPVPSSKQGIAIGCGLAIPEGDPLLGGDPYRMALAAVDECVRNLVCVGADPERIAILDNFCWPSCAKASNMGSLVRAAVGCYDAAKAYRTPFVSGKDSLNNQFRTEDGTVIEIPPTLLITGIGVVEDVSRCVTSDMKRADSEVLVVRADAHDWTDGARVARLVAHAIRNGWVRSAHDASEGGVMVALCEMLIGSEASSIGHQASAGLGMQIDEARLDAAVGGLFAERSGVYVLEIDPKHAGAAMAHLGAAALRLSEAGCRITADGVVRGTGFTVTAAELREAFVGTLDW